MSAIESDSDKGADTNAQRHLHRTGRTINTNSTMFNRVRHSILKWSKVKRDVLRADVRFFRMRHSARRLLEYIVTITTHFVSTAPITSQNVRGNKATLLAQQQGATWRPCNPSRASRLTKRRGAVFCIPYLQVDALKEHFRTLFLLEYRRESVKLAGI